MVYNISYYCRLYISKYFIEFGTYLKNCEYADCEEYVFEDLDHLNEKLIHTFRITDALMAKWKTAGILFRFCLFVRDGTIIGGNILKYKISLDERCCDAGYETAPTQQEIRITDRILKYLIEENC